MRQVCRDTNPALIQIPVPQIVSRCSVRHGTRLWRPAPQLSHCISMRPPKSFLPDGLHGREEANLRPSIGSSKKGQKRFGWLCNPSAVNASWFGRPSRARKRTVRGASRPKPRVAGHSHLDDVRWPPSHPGSRLIVLQGGDRHWAPVPSPQSPCAERATGVICHSSGFWLLSAIRSTPYITVYRLGISQRRCRGK